MTDISVSPEALLDAGSIDLIDEYRRMHARGHFKGTAMLQFAERIGQVCKETSARTLLDYGCGQGEQYTVHQAHKLPGWPGGKPMLYDPAVSASASREFIDLKDARFDGVICTDVLEHLPEDEIPGVVKELHSLATKFLYVTVCTRYAKKLLPCGLNCHLTVRPQTWWIDTLRKDLPTNLRLEIDWNE